MTSADAGKRWVSKYLLAMISTLKILLCLGGGGDGLGLFSYCLIMKYIFFVKSDMDPYLKSLSASSQ